MSLTFGSYQWVPGVGGPTYTATGLAIGAADPDRWVIAAVFSNFQWDGTVASVTIGGVSGTRLFGAPVLTGGGGYWEFWKAKVPTGTTANVVVTTGDAAFWDGAAATYYCIGEPTYFDGKHDGTYTGNTFSVAINVPANGAVIAIASNDGAGTLSGWVGVAADSTDNTEQVYYASADELSAETGRTVSFTTTAASSSTDFYGLGVVSVAVPAGSSDQSLSTTRFVDPDSFGTAVVTRGAVSLAATRYADGDQFGAATVSRGAVTLAQTRYVDADSFGAASVSPGAVSLVAARFVDADGFGAAVASTGSVTLTPAVHADADAFGAATITLGGVTLSAALFVDGDAFGAATVAPGPVSLTTSAYVDPDSFGAATVSQGSGTQNLGATRFDDTDQFGAAVVAPGAVTLTATRHADADSFGTAVVSRGAWIVGPTLLANVGSFGAAIIVPGAVALSAAIYPDPDQFGAARVSGGTSFRRAAFPRDSMNAGSFGAGENGGRLIRPVNGGILVEG